MELLDTWDKISHSITALNQARVSNETSILSSISLLLEQLENAKNTSTSLPSSPPSSLTTPRSTITPALTHLRHAVAMAVRREESPLPGLPESHRLEHALVGHFLQQGYLEAAQALAEEAGLGNVPVADLLRAKTGFQAVEALSAPTRDVAPAISWLEEHQSPSSSNLLFDLHRLRFLQLAESQTEAIGYAQRNFAPFATSRSQEIQTLLGGLLFHSSSSSSSSSPLTSMDNNGSSTTTSTTDERVWDQAKASLMKEIMRTKSCISIVIQEGSHALDEFQAYQHLVGNNTCKRITQEHWKDSECELPIQVDTDHHFHTEFWCPVSQEKTDQKTNPPMLLICGHVVSKNSLMRIAKNRQKFKCPTCPKEQSLDAAREICF